jgi:methylated-DNA-[protein]-cysteine S-methyltransferase
MSAIGFAIFDTPAGVCGIVWRDGGIVGLQLPEQDGGATRRRLQKRYPDAREAPPTADIAEAIAAIAALLSGEAVDLSEVRLDMDGVTEFDRNVYEATRTIPPGSTLTYGEIAKRIGEPGAARAVGRALGANPFPIVVPCHRVLGADGKAGGFSAVGGVETKMRILSIEKARTNDTPALFGDLPLAVKPRR